MELKQFIKILVSLLIFIILIVISIFYMHYRIYNWVESAEAWGQFGDYIGGTLNPILTFCSFLALLITIILQNKQLDVSTRELHNTNITLIDSKRVMSEQLLTQSLQQFDSIFFAMLKDLNAILLELENKGNNNKSILESFHDEVFDTDKIVEIKIENLNKKILLERKISRYFMFLYQILKIIKDRLIENKNIPKEKKEKLIKMYNNIVRASVSEEAMQLLMINCLNRNFEGFKILIEESNFFEHTSFKKSNNYIPILIYASQFYKNKVFDNNIPLFKIPNRKVLISDDLYKLLDYKFIMIEGVYNLLDKLKERIDFFILIISPKIRKGQNTLNEIDLDFEIIHENFIGEDKIVFLKRK